MSITWEFAANACGADTKELKGWPKRLSFEQAAILAAGNRAADFEVVRKVMHDAIKRCDLAAEDAERPREVRMLLCEPDRFTVLPAGPCKMVAAGDVLAWLDEQGRDPGNHVRAWGKACDVAGAESESDRGQAAKPEKETRPRGRKKSASPALLAQILDALERYAAATRQGFDRHAMPGPLGKSADDDGSFHWLCASLCPRNFNRAPSTFAKHRAGLCALAPYAKPTDFYRLALPHIAPELGATLSVRCMPKKAMEIA